MISGTTTDEIPVHRRFSWARLLAAFLVTVLLAGLAAGAFMFGLAEVTVGRALPGVSVAGVSIGGLEPAAATSRLRKELPSLSAGSVVLVRGKSKETITYAELGRDYDYEALISEAVAFGRSGSVPERALDELRGLMRGHAIGLRVAYNRSAVEAAVARIAPRFEVQPIDADVKIADGGAFVTVRGVAGSVVDQGPLVDTIVAQLATLDTGDVTLDVPVRDVEPLFTTAEADAARAQAEQMAANGVALSAPAEKDKKAETFAFSPQAVRGWIAFSATAANTIVPTVVTAAASAAVAKLAAKVAKEPKDATFLVGNGKAVGSVPGVKGRALDVAATLRAIDTALRTAPAGSGPTTVPLSVTPVEPKISSADAAQIAPLMKPLGPKGPDGKYGWTVKYEVSERNYWSKNITIPTLKLNGFVVQPGEMFNFWDAIGEVSYAAGYGDGGAIINGHSQPTGALAGGICSCSTTLFKAAAWAGLEIVERHNHYYWIQRYWPEGLDATVSKTDGGGGQNMRFRNDTAYPIVIRSSASSGIVHFEIWGVPDGRTTTFSKPAISNYTHAGDSVQYTTDLAPGVKKRVEYATNGFNVTVTRTVKDKDGNVLHEDSFYSHYATVTGILLVGKSPDAPPTDQPAEPTPAPEPTPVPEPTPAPEPTPVP
jgi:vancomycin resistance protein YoaR